MERLIRYLRKVPDTRGQRYATPSLMAIVPVARVAGCRTLTEISGFARALSPRSSSRPSVSPPAEFWHGGDLPVRRMRSKSPPCVPIPSLSQLATKLSYGNSSGPRPNIESAWGTPRRGVWNPMQMPRSPAGVLLSRGVIRPCATIGTLRDRLGIGSKSIVTERTD